MIHDALKSEHLGAGARPIMASLCESGDLTAESRAEIKKITERGVFVDYFGSKDFFKQNDILHSRSFGYAISDCTTEDKYSEEYNYCVGAIFVGSPRCASKDVSFLTHHSPQTTARRYEEEFRADLRTRLQVLLEETQPGTVDAVILGGRDEPSNDYLEAVYCLDKIISSEAGFSPAVLTGPNLAGEEGTTAAYFETQKRRLHLVRPRQPNQRANMSYRPRDILHRAALWGGEIYWELRQIQKGRAKNSPFAFHLPTPKEAEASLFSRRSC